jgi:hypothetical protein
LRSVNGSGGFASVLHKGEHDAGTILVVLLERGADARVYERVPSAEGDRRWQLARRENPENKLELDEWLARRAAQDPDLWIVELDIVNAERFIGIT